MLVYILGIILLTTMPLLPAQLNKETHAALCKTLGDICDEARLRKGADAAKGAGAMCAAMQEEIQKETVATLSCAPLAKKLIKYMHNDLYFHFFYQIDLADARYGKEETGWGRVRQVREDIIKDLLHKEKLSIFFSLNPKNRDKFTIANRELDPASLDAQYLKASIVAFFYFEQKHAQEVWRSRNTTYGACSLAL